MRVLGNIRLSRETDESTSPVRQEEAITRWAELHGHTIVGWVRDLDVSGSVSPWERPELGPWLEDDRLPLWDILVGAKVDRISRKLIHFVTLVEWCSERGKAVASATEPINTSDRFGKLIAQILAMFAEFERDAIRERVTDSWEKAIADGRWHGGTVPYGYIPQKEPRGEGWKLAPDPESSAQFKDIVDQFLARKSLTQIANDLNAKGVLPPTEFYRKKTGKDLTGARWSGTSLRLILRSRAPLGVAERNGEVVRGENGLPVQRAEPIISRTDWDQVQLRLDQISRDRPRSAKTSPLLNIAFCIDCGHPLYRLANKKLVRGEEKVHEYYRCRGWRDRLNDCGNSSVNGKDLSFVVSRLMLQHIGELEMQEEIYVPAESHTQELADAKAALDDLLQKTAGKPPAVQEVYRGRIEALEAAIVRLAELPDSPPRVEVHNTGLTYQALWDASDDTERRTLLLKAGVRIEAGPRSGDFVSIGRFERPERYDEAMVAGVYGKIRYVFYLPKNLVGRVIRQTDVPQLV